MARINIEDSLYLDIRFQKLSEKVGGVTMAIGIVAQAFILAQKYWKDAEKPIPKEMFLMLNFHKELLDFGLAEYVNEGESVYIKGSKKQFAWLIQRRDAGRRNIGKKAKRNQTDVKRVESSYSYSSSFSSSNTINLSFICDELERIYKIYPRKTGKSKGMKKLTSDFLKSPDAESDLKKLAAAVKNYSNECIELKYAIKFIKIWSTFASEWRDWVEPKSDSRKEIVEVNPNQWMDF